MDDVNQNNTTQNYTGANPYESTAPSTSTTSGATVTTTTTSSDIVKYASFFERLVAALIDGVLVGLVTGVLSGILSSTGDSGKTLGSLLTMVLSFTYYVYLTAKNGQTIGKKALGLRVQNEATGQNLDYVSAFLREVIGKTISSLVLLLGYLWMLWDPKKQTWHDKIAKSIVVKVK